MGCAGGSGLGRKKPAMPGKVADDHSDHGCGLWAGADGWELVLAAAEMSASTASHDDGER